MDIELTELLTRLLQANHVSDDDILQLRGAIWADEAISEPVVDALFAVNNRLDNHTPVWTEFFVEAVEYFLLNQFYPQSIINDAKAKWLHSKIDKNGHVGSYPEIELLISIIEHAQGVPESLKTYARAQIEMIIISGEGPTRDNDTCTANRINAAEVDLLRRLIFADGDGDGHAGKAVIVDPQVADMLFRIKNTVLLNDNAPSWLTLFVEAVGNHLMGHSDYCLPSHDHDKLRNHTPALDNFFKRTLPADLIGSGTIAQAFKTLFPKQEDRFAKALAIDNSHLISVQEAGWLKTHIAADDQTDAYEKALLTFILDEAEHAPSLFENLRKRA